MWEVGRVGPFTIALFMAAAACATLAIGHFFVWVQRSDQKMYLWFALSAMAASGNALAEASFYSALTVDDFNVAFKWANSLNVAAFVLLFWFLVQYAKSGTRWQGLKVAVTAIFVFAAVANLLLPYGFLFETISSLRIVALPWGETFSLAEGLSSHRRYLSDLAIMGMFVCAVDVTRDLWRRGRRRGARLVGGGFLAYLVLMLVTGTLTDLGLVELPYLYTWAYLFVGMAMSYELAVEVVRAGTLSEEVKSNERRWRSLLENVQLLVAGVDLRHRFTYVNPFFTKVTGYGADELIGSSFLELLPAEEQERFTRSFEESMAGSVEPRAERTILAKSGEARRVVWSRVLLRDVRNVATGLLSIGADVTEQRAAERARDEAFADTRKALAEVEELKRHLEEEVVYLSDEITTSGHFEEIVGNSDALQYVLQKIEQVAPLDATVLIEGETGVGKELFARAVHRRSPRSARPLVKVNCASLPENLIEDELFGHERGAFTGATRLRKGRFELANGGTIFLDEIGELPLELQGKLLRVLQEGEFERVGGDQTLKGDVRVIAATNRNLKREVEAGRFREDLFYRLHVFPITVPALRQRKDDVPLLARTFVQRYAQAQSKRIDTIPAAVMSELERYDWPGNVRELENVLQRAVITSSEGTLRLAASLFDGEPRRAATSGGGALADVERRHIESVLKQCGWRIEGARGAAKILELHPNTLRTRMRKLGITRPAPASSVR